MTDFPRFDFDELDSTQLEVRRRLETAPDAGPFLVTARHQTAGRGRLGRKWSGAADRTLMFSLWCPASGCENDTLGLIPLAVGVALIDWLGQWAPGLLLKWPNDIVTPNGGKLAGILCEGIWDAQRFAGAIVGVGINIRRPPDADAIEADGRKIGSLDEYCQITRDTLSDALPALSRSIRALVGDLLRGRHTELTEAVNTRLLRTARPVTLSRFESENTVGYIEGVSDRGHLLFRRGDDGNVEEITSGELILPDQGIEGFPQQGAMRASDR